MARGDENLKPFEFGPSGPVRARRGVPRWLVAAGIGLVVLAAGAGYLYHFDRALGARLLGGTPPAPSPSVTSAYKWRDADGIWHITDRPPKAGTPYETLRVRGDANLMPSSKQRDDGG